MREYQFKPDIAKKYGVDEAILIHSFAFWIGKNAANGRHAHDGRTWTYNSVAALSKLFPFWSPRQIDRIIKSCISKGALYAGNYNKSSQDRTLWYALDDSILAAYDIASGQISPPETQPDEPPTETVNSISPNGEMEFTVSGNAFHETVTPLPVTNPVTNPVTPPKAPKGSGVFDLCCGDNKALRRALADFESMRKQIKKPMTDRARKMLVKKLCDLSSSATEQIAILEQSIYYSWQDVYPLDNQSKKRGKPGETVGGWLPDPEVL